MNTEQQPRTEESGAVFLEPHADLSKDENPRWGSGMIAEMGPYLDLRAYITTLHAGSMVLLRMGWDFIGNRTRDYWGDRFSDLARLGIVGGAGYIVVYTAMHQPESSRFYVPLLTVGWCITAWCVPSPAHEPVEGTEKEVDEGGDLPTINNLEDVYSATLPWVLEQMGNSNGVHVSQLLEHAHSRDRFTDLDVAGLRGHLEGCGFPVRQQLKVGGSNRPGIHRDELPSQFSPDPSPGEER